MLIPGVFRVIDCDRQSQFLGAPTRMTPLRRSVPSDSVGALEAFASNQARNIPAVIRSIAYTYIIHDIYYNPYKAEAEAEEEVGW
jgi:hypothetical protein